MTLTVYLDQITLVNSIVIKQKKADVKSIIASM